MTVIFFEGKIAKVASFVDLREENHAMVFIKFLIFELHGLSEVGHIQPAIGLILKELKIKQKNFMKLKHRN